MPADTPSFNWLDVAKVVAPLAPTLGGILGGLIPFPGAGLAGQALGNVIASKFGVPATPEAVAKAVTSNPNEVVLAKLREATQQLVAQYQHDALIAQADAEVERAQYALEGKSVDQVNATMRAEIGREHWFFSGWRPTAGWIFDFYAFCFGWLLSWATAQTLLGNPAHLQELQAAWPLFATYLGGLAAMVGVYAYGRTREKVATPPRKV